MFLLQIIVGFLVAAVVLVTGSRVAAAAGAVFALAALGGYLLSIWAELFGFKEVRTTAGIVAGVVEVAAFVVLATLALAPAPAKAAADRRAAQAGRPDDGTRWDTGRDAADTAFVTDNFNSCHGYCDNEKLLFGRKVTPHQLFGRELTEVAPKAGRTDRACGFTCSR